ncbi:glycosyltransferase family 2 protein [Clostridium amazonitimonense]|uniref:glycosyltransferase family 2 protein n=1 Tax=Clostridium amazonitimonense TaxID=1499689 RepID=UPI000509DE0E|nr:glycosyltransferase family 2 protein [Clostridium amazonitimonense]
MEVFNSFLQILSATFSQVVFLISMYYLLLSFFGIVRFKKKKQFKAEKSFALIVAAHNEEAVIQNIVHSLNMLDYPKELYDILVIADNCTDSTARKARDAGANVFERNMKDKRGKGYALEWMFDKIFKMEKKYDSVVIFDADNLVAKDFLTEMNNKLCEGYKVVQGYVDVKNPNDNWVTGCNSIAFWTSNRMFQLSRNNLGLSNQLGGTGFCIDTEILQDLGWGVTCLTEDLEFTCKLVSNGYKVGWAHDAIIYDEKPLTLMQSWAQRKRWMQGFADVSSRYFFKLMKKAIKEFNFVAFDCALYTIQPVILVSSGIAMLINLSHSFMSAPELITNAMTMLKTANFNMIKLGSTLLLMLQFIYTPFLLVLEKKFSLRMFLYYLIYPLYSATWLPIAIQGILNKNKKEWIHTQHTRSIKIHELEKAN